MSRFVEIKDRYSCPYRVRKEVWGAGIVSGQCSHPETTNSACRDVINGFPANCPLSLYASLPMIKFDTSDDFYTKIKEDNLQVAYALHDYESPKEILDIAKNLGCAIGVYSIPYDPNRQKAHDFSRGMNAVQNNTVYIVKQPYSVVTNTVEVEETQWYCYEKVALGRQCIG